jgi:DNA-binding CsgD family transcriptional regulator/tetratricopeptide (TPR) repeat protein
MRTAGDPKPPYLAIYGVTLGLSESDYAFSALADRFPEGVQPGGQVVLISGSAGSGKTRLLRSFTERIAAAGGIAATATASHAERTVPLGVVSQLLSGRDLPPSAVAVRRLLDDPQLETAMREARPEVMSPAAMALYDRLFKLFAEAAERAPALIAIDGVQHADALSVQYVRYAITRIKASRIVMVLTECTAPCLADHLLHADVLRQPDSRWISLTPLPEPAVAELVREHLGRGPAAELAAACFAASGGNPLLARAFLDDNATSADRKAGAGSAFRFAVLSCLCSCNPAATALAQALAVLGEPVPPLVPAQMLDVSDSVIAEAANSLQAAGILAGDRFRCEAARAAVLSGLSTAARAALHASAARALYSHGASAHVLAGHLVAADRVEGGWAVAALKETAELALAENRITDALGYLRKALDACDNDHQRAQVQLCLVQTKWRDDPAGIRFHLSELVDAARDGHLHKTQIASVVNYSLWHGNVDDAGDLLAGLLAPSDGRPERPPVPPHPDMTQSIGYSYPGLAIPLQGRSSEMLELTFRQHNGKAAVPMAERTLQQAHADGVPLAQIVSALAALIITEDLERAAFWCRTLPGKEVALWRAALEAIEAIICFRQGNLRAAEQKGLQALDTLSPKSWGVAIGLPIAAVILATTAAGKLESTETWLRAPIPGPMFQTTLAPLYLHARGRYYLATDRLQAALADFQACGHLMTEWNLDRPSFVPWRTDTAQALLRMGDEPAARDLAKQQLRRIAITQPRVRGISLRVLGLASGSARRPRLLAEAAEVLKGSGDRLELAYALADLSHWHHELGDKRRGRTLARQARVLAEQCRAEPLKDALPAPSSRSAAVADTSDFAVLSAAERRVAVLAASGYTNLHISRRLHITVSTVEQHLTRVYRKLEVRGRSDLPLPVLLEET